MRVLVCGASGFIGRAISRELRAAGHEVVRGVRRADDPTDIVIDYAADTDPSLWLPRLHGIEAVVNAVGIIAERPGATFANLHEHAPSALFAACAQAGVRRIVQISALGADAGDTRYFRSKAAADRKLAQLPVAWLVLRPSLVYGEDGASAAAFRMLATLPVIATPALPEAARFQPVHVDDLAAAVVRALDVATPAGRCIDCTGATAHSLREMIAGYRRAFRLGRALWISVPAAVMALTARLSALIPGSTLNPDTWRMLQAGNAAGPARFAELLGRAPRGLADFIGGADAERLRARALGAWQKPLLRLSLAAVWIASAITSAFIHPHAAGMAVLAQVGLTGQAAVATLYGASLLDFALGIATLLRPGRITWIAQTAVIVAYTAIISVALPEWLAHPFAPVLKNLPMLAILAVLLAEERPWTTSS